MSEFTKKVIQLVQSIPKGKVATYGQIAELAGKPQGSRGVGWILHSSSIHYKLPWHRVLNSKGKISFEKGSHNYRQQKRLLEKEGVQLNSSGQLKLSQFQWKKKVKSKRISGNQPQMFRALTRKPSVSNK